MIGEFPKHGTIIHVRIETSINELQGHTCAPPEGEYTRTGDKQSYFIIDCFHACCTYPDEDSYVAVALGIVCGMLGLLLAAFLIVCICVLLKRNSSET